jgi:HPt (histidine-containing phosphotransfer) domain-containing protein
VKELYAALGRWIGWEVDTGEAPPAMPPVTPVTVAEDDGSIDDTILDEVLEFAGKGGEQLVRDLIDLFFAEVPARLENMRRGAAERDPERVTRGAHAMKGGASNLGAVRAAALCGRLEKQSRAGNLAGAEQIIAELEAEVERVRVRLRARVETDAARV